MTQPDHALTRSSPFNFYLLLVLPITAYAILRFRLNIEYGGATFHDLYSLNAAIPFGYRILIPLLSRPLVAIGLSIEQAFLVWEFISTYALILGLQAIFKLYMPRSPANALSACVLLFLPLTFLLQSRWPIYYPHDTPAMAFIAWASYLILSQQWKLLIPLVFAATLNRESAFLIPFIAVVVCIGRISNKTLCKIAALLIVSYILGRTYSYLLTFGNPTPYGGSLALKLHDEWRFYSNTNWLLDPSNLITFFTHMGFLPFLHALLKHGIPAELKYIHVTAAIYLVMLFFVGNMNEPRILGEAVVIFYIPCAIALAARYSGTNINTTYLPALNQGVLINILDWFANHLTTSCLAILCSFAILLHFN